jgi:hypothetical protein
MMMKPSNDPKHLIATVGCDDLIIIHTPERLSAAKTAPC